MFCWAKNRTTGFMQDSWSGPPKQENGSLLPSGAELGLSPALPLYVLLTSNERADESSEYVRHSVLSLCKKDQCLLRALHRKTLRGMWWCFFKVGLHFVGRQI